MNKLFFKIIAISLFFFSFMYKHDFHISNTTINYNTKGKTFEYTLHLFIDDLETALEKENEKLFIGTELEKPVVDSLILDYANRSFQTTVNQNTLRLNYLGKETSEDLTALHIYFESEPYKIVTNDTLHIYNDLFIEVFDDQQNIIRFNVNNINKDYLLLNNSNREKTLYFSE